MNIASWLTKVLALWSAFPFWLHAEETPDAFQRPNVVWIMAEDIGTELACYGHPAVNTPNLDALAQQGARYTNAFCTAPSCTPSRNAMMLGVYQTRTDTQDQRRRGVSLPPGMRPITHMLRDAGYYTALGCGYSEKTDLNFTASSLFDGNDWRNRKSGQPFFAQITLHQTHRVPNTGWDPIRDQSVHPVDPKQVELPPYFPDHPACRKDWAMYLDAMEYVDAQVGEILQRLEDEGIADNTVVIFIGDNGRCHLRGKCWLYDGGIHVPLIMRWPERIDPDTVNDDMVSMIDISATVLDIAAVELPNYLDGIPILRPNPQRRDHIFAARDLIDEVMDHIRCVRTDRFKYIRNYTPENGFRECKYVQENRPMLAVIKELHAQGKLNEAQQMLLADVKPEEELYDLHADPHELNNLADSTEHQETLNELRSLLDGWIADTHDQGLAHLELPSDDEVINAVHSASSQSVIPEAALIAIRDGFDDRVAGMFAEQKPLAGEAIGSYCDLRASGWNAPQRYAYPRIEYAAANLWFGQNIESANQALIEYAEYFIENPKQVLHRDHFHWHSEMAFRLIEQYGQEGTKAPGLLEPETEDTILEAIWLYSKRRQEDQVGENTKAEADAGESNTWYIYESENHHAQSFCTLWHFAKLAKDKAGFKNRKYDDGRTASEHFQSWNEYLNRYFTERAKKGIYIEAMSRDYNLKALKGIFNIYDFATHPDLKRRAGLYLTLYFTYWGQEQIDGVAGGGKSRLYSDISPGTSEYGYLFFGLGEKPRFTSTLLSAMTTNYRPPLVVVDIVCDREGRGNYEVLQWPLGLANEGHAGPPIYHMRTDYGGIARYSYCTPDFIIGTSMIEARPAGDWALISSQNRSHGAIFAGDNNAGILPQCDKTGSNRSYNAQWSVQRKGTLICQKLETSRRAGRTKVWFSAAGLSEPIEEGNWVFAESKGAYAAVRVVDGGFSWEDERSRTKGIWLVCNNEYSPVILEVDQKSNYKSFADFQAEVAGNALSFEHTILQYTGIYGDSFTFFADYSQAPQINGKTVDYAPRKAYDSPFLRADWNSGVVHIQKAARSLTLDFN